MLGQLLGSHHEHMNQHKKTPADLLCKKTENHLCPHMKTMKTQRRTIIHFIQDLRQCQQQRPVGTITTAEARADSRLLALPAGDPLVQLWRTLKIFLLSARRKRETDTSKYTGQFALLNRPAMMDGPTSHSWLMTCESKYLSCGIWKHNLCRHSEVNKVTGEISAPLTGQISHDRDMHRENTGWKWSS